MRDYSFGNFISDLRERKGLSQYQLGVLIGVSDKAVSKWENGVAKPRTATLKRLAEVLEVRFDELLFCEYNTFNKERKDLFAMKNKIIEIAKNRMKELYGDKPPIRIVNRFNIEEQMLKGQETLLWMGFFGQLNKKIEKKGLGFEIRGAHMGASFIAWLLNGTNVNPLPAHYYCPVCKKVEFVLSEKCGLDLLDKKCSCGRTYQKDGFGISEMNMYPLKNCNEINVTKGSTKIIKECLQDFFNDYGQIREIKINYEKELSNDIEQPLVSKFILFSQEAAGRYLEEVISIPGEDYYKVMQEWSILTVVEDVSGRMDGDFHVNKEFQQQEIYSFWKYT